MEYETYEEDDYDDIYSGNESYPMDDYEYDIFIYRGFSFERPVYMYIWGILVIITFIANILVISVLLHKKMRTATNLILVAIAISDSMTGLVTLPTYWAVYTRYSPSEHLAFNHCAIYNSTDMGGMDVGDGSAVYNATDMEDMYVGNGSLYIKSTLYENLTFTESNTVTGPPINITIAPQFSPSLDTNATSMNLDPVNRLPNPDLFGNETSLDDCMKEYDTISGYHLPKDLCRWFMISKFFLSKVFHTISIWLTLFLGFQRFISVAYPFLAQTIFSKWKVTIVCGIIGLLAPVLHVFQLIDEKAVRGMCQWESDGGCGKTCSYVIVSFIMCHFLPCFMLVIFTILFIVQLTRSSSRVSQADCNKGNAAMRHRNSENRRVTIIVTLIVMFFLIPEIPYGGFLLSVVVKQLTESDMDLETNRKIHLVYEILLLLSFHANFYIYTFFNRRFRNVLINSIANPILSLCGVRQAWEVTSSLSGTRRRTANTETNTTTKIEMKSINNPSSRASSSNHTPETSRCLNGHSHSAEDANGERSKFLKEEPSGIYPSVNIS